MRGLAEHDVAVLALLLESRRAVHRVADDLALVPRHHLAVVDGDAQAGGADGAPLLLREGAERLLHRDGCADGADRVVLCDVRDAERRSDAVAEQLPDGAALRFAA